MSDALVSEPIVLDLCPHEVARALEALRESRGMVAMAVAVKLEAAAPEHMAVLREVGWFSGERL